MTMNLAHRPPGVRLPAHHEGAQGPTRGSGRYPLIAALYSAVYSVIYPPFIFGPSSSVKKEPFGENVTLVGFSS